MSKYIKLYPTISFWRNNTLEDSDRKVQSFSIKTFFTRILIAISFILIGAITVMAFFTSMVLFKNLLVGLFIVGCVLFIKGLSDEKSNVERIKRNTNN